MCGGPGVVLASATIKSALPRWLRRAFARCGALRPQHEERSMHKHMRKSRIGKGAAKLVNAPLTTAQ
jgi:hypothetical protein